MELANDSPFEAHVSVGMDGWGFERLTVVVKGTFALDTLTDGVPGLSDEQDPITLADEYRGEPDATSLRVASDLAAEKPLVDFTLEGHAWPAKGGDRSVDVAVRLSDMEKTVRVFGPRSWVTGPRTLAPGRPAPMHETPLTYELAFGGVDRAGTPAGFLPENPVGLGFKSRHNPLDFRGQPAPQLELTRAPVTSPAELGSPAGFGPVARHWAPRRHKAGTFDAQWKAERFPLLPRDFDPAFEQVAPTDQQLPEYVRGGESLVIVGATAGGAVVCELPRERPSIRAIFASAEERLQGNCDTVHVDTNRMRLTLAWRASIPIQGRVHEFEAVTVRHRRRRRLR